MLHDNIKALRKEKGITQEELAARTGLSQRSIAAYESQGVVAHYRNIVKLAAVLQVAVEYLIDDEMQESIYT